MSSVPKQTQSLGMGDLAMLARSLYNMNGSMDESDAASAVSGRASQNLSDRMNATNSAADAYQALVAALKGQIMGDPTQEVGDLTNRSDQIFSSLAGTVDRGNAISASQGYAQAMKRGMGDSTQAVDQAGTLTRNFGDVYAKLREMANQRAFDELNKNKTLAGQNLATATQGWASMNNAALAAAKDLQTRAATNSATASQRVGSNFSDILGTKVAGWATDQIDSKFKEAGGFSGLLSALGKGMGFEPESYDTPSATSFMPEQTQESAPDWLSDYEYEPEEQVAQAEPAPFWEIDYNDFN